MSADQFVAFEGMNRLASGTLQKVAKIVSKRLEVCPEASILVFDESTGTQTDFDLRHTTPTPLSDATKTPVGPGRPKLGVVGREVTLLPRHWEWLNSQPGGASVALRKLVETARKDNAARDETRRRHEAAYRFMSALAGDLRGHEEALRSLFADDRSGVAQHSRSWPPDVQSFMMQLAFPTSAPAAPRL